MKVAAHPLMVAVALGLLAPTALEAVEDEDERTSACADCGEADDLPAPDLASTVGDTDDAEAYWTSMEAPSAEAFDAVEAAWNVARTQV